MTPSKQELLGMLSNNDVTFYIPPYQRNYEWDNEQCEVFLEDIMKTARANLNGLVTEHFFGTVTYFQSEQVFGQPAKLILIDGQQRITTTMLFFIALRDIITDESLKKYIDQKFLKNDNAGGDAEYKIKLKQVETDWEAYKKIVLGLPLTNEDKTAAVYHNYKFFCDELRKVDERNGITLKDLIEKGLTKFSIVTIQLEPDKNKWENPQEIFESMNSLGKPLSLADLIRNYLLLGLSADKQDRLYHNYWLHIEKTLPDLVSSFIRDYMQCKFAKPYPKAVEANYKELYAIFKGLFAGKNSEDILKDLTDYTDLYACITLGKPSSDSKIDRKLKDIRTIGASTTFSFILEILKKWKEDKLSNADAVAILDVLEIYVLRHRLVKLGAAENKAMPLWNNQIPQIIGSPDKKIALYRFIAGLDVAMRMPNDAELKKNINRDFYGFKQLKFLFALMEEKITKVFPDLSDKNLQIEHIMPQTLNEDWKKMLGNDYESVHNEYLHSLGNLTLIYYNQELGNEEFSKKKDIYINNSALQISQREITDKDVWNKDAIENRTAWIVDFLIKEVLPIPDNLFNTVNKPPRSTKKHTQSFEVLGLVGKKINYIDDKSIVATVVNDKEVAFEGKLWKLSPLTREIKERKGQLSPSGSYQGSIHWEYKGTRIFDLYTK
jgi:uncharacterized protein with ParB-like and HNH nuclease domain